MGYKRIIAGTGTGLSILWGAYSHFTTIRDLPDDAGEVAQMLTDPPIYLPWLLAACFILFLGWSLWRRSERGGEQEGLEPQVERGFQQIHYGPGHNIHADNVQFGHSDLALTSENKDDLRRKLDSSLPVNLSFCMGLGQATEQVYRLVHDFLSEEGYAIKAEGFRLRSPAPRGVVVTRDQTANHIIIGRIE